MLCFLPLLAGPTKDEVRKNSKLAKLRKGNQIADGCIKQKNGEWIPTATCHHNVLFGTGDHGFRRMLNKLTNAGHTTLLTYGLNSTALFLLGCVHYNADWRSFLFAIPKVLVTRITESIRADEMARLEKPILEIGRTDHVEFRV